MITRAELKGVILRKLNKTANHPGFYGDDKINDAIQEAMDYVAAEMFMADEGWQTKIWTIPVPARATSIEMPEDLAMVKNVRALVGDVYVPLVYDAAWEGVQQDPAASVATQWGSVYRINDNALYFNPPMDQGGKLLIDGFSYGAVLANDLDPLPRSFDRCMRHFIAYKACSIMASSIEKMSRPWAKEEDDWRQKMVDIVNKRNRQTTTIREFDS